MNHESNLHSHIAGIVDTLKAGGFKAYLNHDPEQYKAYVRKIAGYSLTSPLDSAFVEAEGKFLWLRIEDTGGKIACIEVGRSVLAPLDSGGLNQLLMSRSFFGTKHDILPVLTHAPSVNLSGDLGYMGGGFVDPAYRNNGIMSLTAQLTMLHLLRCFPIDHVFGLVKAHHVARSLRLKGYGFTSATMLSWAYWGESAGPEELFLVHADRSALLRRIEGPVRYALSNVSRRKPAKSASWLSALLPGAVWKTAPGTANSH